jgi:hypothetical protein
MYLLSVYRLHGIILASIIILIDLTALLTDRKYDTLAERINR